MGDKSNENLENFAITNSVSEFMKELSMIDDTSLKITKLKSFVNCHEEEFKKISVFKSELPLCMRLLEDVIEKLKEEVDRYEKKLIDESLTNFDKNLTSTKSSGINNDKKYWLSDAQLCITPDPRELINLNSKPSSQGEKGESSSIREKQNKETVSADSSLQVTGTLRRSSQHNKSRLCWSSELHQQFVNAVNQLGGPQVASPKRIRELMHKNRLTDNEIKSHLQKYRIHIRNLPSSSTVHVLAPLAPAPAPTQEPVPPPGQITRWLLHDQRGDSSTSRLIPTTSPQGPLHLGGSSRAASTSEEEKGANPKSYFFKSRFSHGH